MGLQSRTRLRRVGFIAAALTIPCVVNLYLQQDSPLRIPMGLLSTDGSESSPVGDVTFGDEKVLLEDLHAIQDSTPDPTQDPIPTPDPVPAIYDPPIVQDAAYSSNLRRLCDGTEWVDGLWLHCHGHMGPDKLSMGGGLNNARNRLQTCIRLAIDAGAGLVIATASIRNETNLGGTSGIVCPEVYWDMKDLNSTLAEQCPKLQLRSCGNTAGISRKLAAPYRKYSGPDYIPGTFRNFTTEILNKANITNISDANPVAIEFGDAFLSWNSAKADELNTIQKDLFNVIKYNRDLLGISSKILQSPQLHNGFIGVHLRGESDWPKRLGNAKAQMQAYSMHIEGLQNGTYSKIKTIFVSCGDSAAIGRFRKKVAPFGYTVHDKWSLLADQPTLVAQVNALTFDEKAVVEYQMLVNANYFIGIITSSMSDIIAYARSVNDAEEYFTTYIFPGSDRDKGENGTLYRVYPNSGDMKGNKMTKLMVWTAPDIMDAFP